MSPPRRSRWPIWRPRIDSRDGAGSAGWRSRASKCHPSYRGSRRRLRGSFWTSSSTHGTRSAELTIDAGVGVGVGLSFSPDAKPHARKRILLASVSEGRFELPPGVTRTRPSRALPLSPVVRYSSRCSSERVHPSGRTPRNGHERLRRASSVTNNVASSRYVLQYEYTWNRSE